MMKWILFSAIAIVYVVCCTPDFTWVNADCDGFYYYTKGAHLVDWGSNPMWAAAGHTAVHIPWGNDPWKVALVCCALPAVLTSVFAFFAVRKQTANKYAPYIAAVAFAASPIVIAQATIHDVYSLATMFVAASYLALVYKKWKTVWLLLGLAMWVHWFTVVPAVIAFLVWKRELLKYTWIGMLMFLGPFVFEHFWGAYPTLGYWWDLRYVFLNGAVENVPTRLVEAGTIWLVGLSLAWIPAILFLKGYKQSYPFLIAMGIPLCHLLTCPSVDGYVQSYGAMFFGSVAAGLGVEYLRVSWMSKAVLAVGCVSLVLLPLTWDVGNTLDKSPTTCRKWLDQVEDTPEGSIILCSRRLDGVEDSVGGLVRSVVEMLNRESGIDRHYVFPNIYVSPNDFYGERKRLQDEGLITPLVPCSNGQTYYEHYDENMLTLAVANNTKAYYTIVTDPETFGCELVELK
jgi:hypothetical protein